MRRDGQTCETATRAGEAGERPARLAGDDFFCLRFATWYRSLDCAYRTKFRTCPACLDCDQGRFNLKRHAAALADPRRARRCLGG